MSDKTKACKGCGVVKPIDEFYWDGRLMESDYCQSCDKIRTLEYMKNADWRAYRLFNGIK